MTKNIISRQALKARLNFSQKEPSLEMIERQRHLSLEAFNQFATKHYPRIFLDQRLCSRILK